MATSVQDNAISSFTGEYEFLSNFYNSEVKFEGITYPSAEVAFQASKLSSYDDKLAFSHLTSAQAKFEGRKLTPKEGWDELKVTAMSIIIKDKFTQNEVLKAKLLATNDMQLVYSNSWHDNFWGTCNCAKCTQEGKEGTNLLGKIIMQVRDNIRLEKVKQMFDKLF